MATRRHKVFVSFHHDSDQEYADELMDFYGSRGLIIDKSMYDDYSHLENETILRKIRDDHLRDSTVTVVLVGKHTWGRKWVDWEIHSSLRGYADRTRNGLVGIYLPGHSDNDFRLTDNVQSGYAVTLDWNEIENKFIDAVHKAFNRRKNDDLINNTRELRERNAPLEPKQYSPRKKGDDCFIATVVFGSPYAMEIYHLRNWRDTKLKKSLFGNKFIYLYYKYGPKFANIIENKSWFKERIRSGIGIILRIIKS